MVWLRIGNSSDVRGWKERRETVGYFNLKASGVA